MKLNPIQAFIVQSEDNLRIAMSVTDALPATKDLMAKAFVDKLKAELVPHLPSWKFDRERVFFTERYASFFFLKPAWQGQYCIMLQFGDWGQSMIIGVCREEAIHGKREACPELLQAVAKEFPAGKSIMHWWEAQVVLDSPAGDWTRPEVMWRMYTDESFLRDVADQLLVLARSTEVVIDGLVAKYAAIT